MLLANLPGEILHMVVLEIASGNGYHSNRQLRHFVCCSRRLHEAATPTLYVEFEQNDPNQELSRLKSFLENPELGKHVRRFFSGSDWYRTAMEFSASPSFDMVFLRRCHERMASVCDDLDILDEWADGLNRVTWNAVTALLLTCMPALEEVTFNKYASDDFNPIDHVLANAAGLQYQRLNMSLSKLRAVDLWSRFEADLNTVIPFLQLDSVKNLFFFDFRNFTHLVEPMQVEKDSLELETCTINEVELVSFLACFKSLKKFIMHYTWATYDDFMPHWVGAALSHLKGSLESLEVHTAYVPEDTVVESRIGSLTDFERLRVIALGTDVLFGHMTPVQMWPRLLDLLPNSVESLELIRYDESVVAQVLDLMVEKQAFPRLSRIILDLELNSADPKLLEDRIEKLGERCQAAGVDLQLPHLRHW